MRTRQKYDSMRPTQTHRYTVANWSIGGASGPELLLLAARAAAHNPDLVMLVSHSEPFAYNRANMPLSFYISDSNQLACITDVREHLPRGYRERLVEPGFGLRLEYHAALLRLRGAFIEQRDARWVPGS